MAVPSPENARLVKNLRSIPENRKELERLVGLHWSKNEGEAKERVAFKTKSTKKIIINCIGLNTSFFFQYSNRNVLNQKRHA